MLDFLTVEAVVETNKSLGYHPLNISMVGSALSSWHYYDDVESQIASVILGICKNHAFQDGNKRTATLTYYMLCNVLGFVSLADDKMFDTIIMIASSNKDVDAVRKLLFP